jgi:hypothetical protein
MSSPPIPIQHAAPHIGAGAVASLGSLRIIALALGAAAVALLVQGESFGFVSATSALIGWKLGA